MQDWRPVVVLSSEPQITVNETRNERASDEHLMLAFSKGSPDAFSELFRRYKQAIYGFFRRRVADPSHAEELTQEAFLALVRSGSRYEPRALFRTYLYAIALKILRGHRRKAAFRSTFLGHRDQAPDVLHYDGTESALWVRRAVAKLDPINREILMLREFEQLSYAEIADLLRLPVNTVRSRLFRARLALRSLLEPGGLPVKNAEPVVPLTMPGTVPQKGNNS
jgi:RNA polymerase sigma factor (sigma-70 family)